MNSLHKGQQNNQSNKSFIAEFCCCISDFTTRGKQQLASTVQCQSLSERKPLQGFPGFLTGTFLYFQNLYEQKNYNDSLMAGFASAFNDQLLFTIIALECVECAMINLKSKVNVFLFKQDVNKIIF